MNAILEQKYFFNDLINLCYWYIENAVIEVNDTLIYQNPRLYDKCNDYILNGRNFTTEQKQRLLDFFNK